MRSLVVYESWFGNTQRLAEKIAGALAEEGDVELVSVDDPLPSLDDVDLIVLGAPTHVHVRADPDEDRAVERLPLHDLEPRAGDDASLAEEAEHLRLGVGDPHEGGRLAGLELGERRRSGLGELQLAGRDRVAVRVDGRVAELRRDQLLELLRERVLEHLGLGVYLVPRHP